MLKEASFGEPKVAAGSVDVGVEQESGSKTHAVRLWYRAIISCSASKIVKLSHSWRVAVGLLHHCARCPSNCNPRLLRSTGCPSAQLA